jgi:hypothetical protein
LVAWLQFLSKFMGFLSEMEEWKNCRDDSAEKGFGQPDRGDGGKLDWEFEQRGIGDVGGGWGES